MENSLAVAEYSEANLPLLKEQGIAYPHVFLLPPAGDTNTLLQSKDAFRELKRLVYGDFWSSSRRFAFLEIIKQRQDWTFVNNIFGQQLWELLARHEVVVNYHYFDRSILEVFRVLESLSCGCRVITEASDYIDLDPSVMRFVEQIEATSPESFAVQCESLTKPFTALELEELRGVLRETEARFEFALKRMLFALNILGSSAPSDHQMVIDFSKPICISLPETFERREMARDSLPEDFSFFPGLRHKIGWKGCGLSYKFLAQAALNAGVETVTICEDDVLLPNAWGETYTSILRYLDQREEPWDVYVGLIADLNPSARVLRIDEFDGLRFVTLNTMTSTVFNIYHRRLLTDIAKWDPEAGQASSNTIDRFLENKGQITVVTSPDIVFGHREQAVSTLWGFDNNTYEPLISASRARLLKLIDEFNR